MPVRYERPISHAAYMSRRLALFALFLFVIGVGLHRFGPFETPSFFAILLLSGLLAAIAVYMAIIGLAMLWNRGARGGKSAVHALVLALPPLMTVALGYYFYRESPPIYDVTTDVAQPPDWPDEVKADQSWLGPRQQATPIDRALQAAAYPGLTGRRYEGGLDRIYAAARAVALDAGVLIETEKGAPGNELMELPDGKTDPDAAVPDALDNIPVPAPRPAIEDLDPNKMGADDAYIQGVQRSTVLGLREDIVIRMHEEAETTLVDVRVAARYGHHDFGAGERLISRYLKALDAALLGVAGG
jgi:hypothetical protein